MFLSSRPTARKFVRSCGRLYTTGVNPPPPPPPVRPFGTSTSVSPTIPQSSESLLPTASSGKEPLDPARGYAATMRVAREGVLDKRYRPAARRVTAIICAVPVLLVTSWVLYKRQFLGEEQKRIPEVKSAEAIVEGSPSTALNEQAIFPADHDDSLKT